MVRDFDTSPELGDRIFCRDDNFGTYDEITVEAEVVKISEVGVVMLKIDHDTWSD